jgi:integrase
MLVQLRPELKLQTVSPGFRKQPLKRIAWETLPKSFRSDVDRHLDWCARPDPFSKDARTRALAPRSRKLRRDLIHAAVAAALGAGIDVRRISSLSSLVEYETFKALLRHRWQSDGDKLSARFEGIAQMLIAIASEWVKASPGEIAALKKLRRMAGSLPQGLTDKNRNLLRRLDDPRLLQDLVKLPDKLWRRARIDMASRPKRAFLDLQTALALDILLHVPLRMANLCSLTFDKHLYWPQGPGKPAFLVLDEGETKNRALLEFEVPTTLAERLLVFRKEIAARMIGATPTCLFVHRTGKPRVQTTITRSIQLAVLRNLGLRLTPHQFRHVAAKIVLDANPGALEQVRQLLGHRNSTITSQYYAGIDTRRAGRAHADLLIKLREQHVRVRRGRGNAR